MAQDEGNRDFIRLVAAYFVPPVGVWLQTGFGFAFFLNIILSLLFYVPGVIHAIWVIATTNEDGSRDPDGMRDFVALVLGALFPPAGVFLKAGIGVPLIINCVLLWAFWLPAMAHAAWVCTQPSDSFN